MTQPLLTTTAVKVVLLGEPAVGKSSLLRRWQNEDLFLEGYRATAGLDYAPLQIASSSNEEGGGRLQVQCYDVAGAERFGTRTDAYYRECAAAVFVADAARPATLAALAQFWLADFAAKAAPPGAARILLVNKADLSARRSGGGGAFVGAAEAADFAAENGFCGWRTVSARTGAGVAESLQLVARTARAAAAKMGVAVVRRASPPPRKPQTLQKTLPSAEERGPRLFTNFHS